jgi:hypothetical protein
MEQRTNNNSPLSRRLGLFTTILVGIGVTLGAGIYVLVGVAARQAGNTVRIPHVILACYQPWLASCNLWSYIALCWKCILLSDEAGLKELAGDDSIPTFLLGFIQGSICYAQEFFNFRATNWICSDSE